MHNRAYLLPLLAGFAAAANVSVALDLTASAEVLVEYTDNARKSSEAEMSEVQEEIELAVAGTHGGEELTADFQYRLDHRIFNDDSQGDETAMEGFATLSWEQIEESLFWEFSHRRKDVLRDSALVDLRENRDERDITEISPLYIARITPVDSLQARLTYAMIKYQEADRLDSVRYGGSLSWRHALSVTDSFMVTAQSTQSDFDSQRQDDIRYDSASFSYASMLARLSYRATLGINKAIRDERDDATGPLYGIDATYDDGLRQWHIRLDSRITDSSLGDGNQNIFDNFGDTDTTLGEVDIIEKSSLEAGVTTGQLCTVCELRGTVFYDQEDYETQPRDNKEYGVEVALDYLLDRRSTVGATYRYRSIEYSGDITTMELEEFIQPQFDNYARSDYKQHELLFRYAYRLTSELSAQAFVGFITRDQSDDVHRGYDENRIGVSVRYLFF